MTVSNKDTLGNATSYTVTTSSDSKYLVCTYYYASGNLTEEEIRNSIMIEQSSTASDYIAHAEQNAPLSLGNIEAYEGDEIQIYYVQKAGYKKVTGARLVKNMGEIVLDGSETWYSALTQQASYKRFGTKAIQDLVQKPDSSATLIQAYCNYFRILTANQTYTTAMGNGISVNSSGEIYVYFDDYKEAMVDNFKIWLSTHNTQFVYPLATPITTPITDPTLLAQLETLINMKTYKEVTNIDLTGEDLAPVLDCDYYQDMSTLNDRLDELEARIELLEE